ncbi:MAG: helix-turn-helix transcriptional regulator [Oscillospiraceae bacterium]|nr:helix-turn-helix transcriptional regulator [Oscillospiraceae bacterium]
MEISALIKKSRNESGLTQEQAAESLGVSRQTISNWENGKSYPDIISVIKMSDLYSVSLDYLLKEETSLNGTYKEYLEESTNTVKSKERLAKVILIIGTLLIWTLCSLAPMYIQNIRLAQIAYDIIPITFFFSSAIIGTRDYFGKFKWISVLVFALMYFFVGTVDEFEMNNQVYRQVIWWDPINLFIGASLSIAGITIGTLIRKKKIA